MNSPATSLSINISSLSFFVFFLHLLLHLFKYSWLLSFMHLIGFSIFITKLRPPTSKKLSTTASQTGAQLSIIMNRRMLEVWYRKRTVLSICYFFISSSILRTISHHLRLEKWWRYAAQEPISDNLKRLFNPKSDHCLPN